jgi:hypothetical protein
MRRAPDRERIGYVNHDHRGVYVLAQRIALGRESAHEPGEVMPLAGTGDRRVIQARPARARQATAARAKPRTSDGEASLAMPPITWIGTARSPVRARIRRSARQVPGDDPQPGTMRRSEHPTQRPRPVHRARMPVIGGPHEQGADAPVGQAARRLRRALLEAS